MNEAKSETYARLSELIDRLQSQDVPLPEKERDAMALGNLAETLLYVKDHGVDSVSMLDENEFSNIRSMLPEDDSMERASEQELKALLKEKDLTIEDVINFIRIQNLAQPGGDLPAVRTKRPSFFVTPLDKISSKAFNHLENGALYDSEPIAVAMEKRGSKRKIDTLVSINFEGMEQYGIKVSGRRELDPYDREIHDAIATLYSEGGNKYITLQMIYQTISGDPNAKLNPKQSDAITHSIRKMMGTTISIDAKEEAQMLGYDSLQTYSHLLPAEMATATLNGTAVTCLHVLKPLPLYSYAVMKNQVDRVDISLLKSPISKNEENITLQGYLLRRILQMKGKSRLNRTIVYETVFKQINIAAPSEGALRKKKTMVRKKVKKLLDDWIQKEFIYGYKENLKGNSIYSVTIQLSEILPQPTDTELLLETQKNNQMAFKS